MKPIVFLRGASVLTLIHAAMHTIGGVFGKPVPGLGAAAFAVMQANRFVAMGATRSYFDFYRGLGLGITLFLTIEGIAFWQLGALSRSHGSRLRPVLATFLVGYLALAANSYLYFFYGPVIAEALIAACLGMAIIAAKPVGAAVPESLAASRA